MSRRLARLISQRGDLLRDDALEGGIILIRHGFEARFAAGAPEGFGGVDEDHVRRKTRAAAGALRPVNREAGGRGGGGGLVRQRREERPGFADRSRWRAARGSCAVSARWRIFPARTSSMSAVRFAKRDVAKDGDRAAVTRHGGVGRDELDIEGVSHQRTQRDRRGERSVERRTHLADARQKSRGDQRGEQVAIRGTELADDRIERREFVRGDGHAIGGAQSGAQIFSIRGEKLHRWRDR